MGLRNLSENDLPELLRIEQLVSVVPWSEEAFKTCFKQNCVGWVVSVDNKLIAFIIISHTKDDCHILNLCVAWEYQRQGYGNLLLSKALQFAKQQKIGVMYLEVRKSNIRAINLYKKMNFLSVGERKNYYPTVSGREDALIFAINLLDTHTSISS